MPTSTVNKDTARERLSKYNNVEFDSNGDPVFSYDQMLQFAREIAGITWDASWNRFTKDDLKRTEPSAPDKETYLTNLFKE